MSDAFDVIPFADIKGDWKKLGSGSFGNVYKGNYLGIDVAIKEVLPSKDYDVAKYFEREWRLMKEARHPNVVLYLGLSRAPDPDGRIFIISEFIENGNLRNYIHDKSKPLPWRLRLSFATDIARALAYLHARRCIHRDLKGENLLVTANGRLKITDFGFARIAARNADESRRLTFCGTDSYMSPEILLGEQFDLPTDIYSLGIILCEIASRRLADDRYFKRAPPLYMIDQEEIHKLANPGCPPDFMQLAIDCLNNDPARRPTTRQILDRMREIEAEVLARPSEADDSHVGSVKFMTGKRPHLAPRIPSFGMGIGKDIRSPADKSQSSDEESSDDELMEAVSGLARVDINSLLSGTTTAGHGESQQPLLNGSETDYSTTVIRAHSRANPSEPHPPLASVLTIRPSPNPNVTSRLLSDSPTEQVAPSISAVGPAEQKESGDSPPASTQSDPLTIPVIAPSHTAEPSGATIKSFATVETYRTAPSALSSAAATEGSSMIRAAALVHRFTLIKPGAKRIENRSVSPSRRPVSPLAPTDGWSPFDFFFSSGLLAAKCDLCSKRIGWKPILECDDCGMRAHVKCGETAPRDCGLRPPRARTQASPPGSPSAKLKDKSKSAR